MRASRSVPAAACFFAAITTAAAAQEAPAATFDTYRTALNALMQRQMASVILHDRQTAEAYRKRYRDYRTRGGRDSFDVWAWKVGRRDLYRYPSNYPGNDPVGKVRSPYGGADRADLLPGLGAPSSPPWLNPHGARAGDPACSYYPERREDGSEIWHCAQ